MQRRIGLQRGDHRPVLRSYDRSNLLHEAEAIDLLVHQEVRVADALASS